MTRRSSRPTLLEQARAYRKAGAGLLLAVGTWGATASVTGGIDGPEWFGLLVALATGLGVAQAKNVPVRRRRTAEAVTTGQISVNEARRLEGVTDAPPDPAE